jgi:hypothetical protein
MERKIFALEDLQRLCSYWQERLGLSHWRIVLRIVRGRDLGEELDGCNYYRNETETAVISILDPVDYPGGPFEQDMEVTLVRELLHILMGHVANPQKDTPEHIYLEATINRLARTLVELKRTAN